MENTDMTASGCAEKEYAITFIIPAYHAERTLERTLDSILRQSDGRWRAVVVDDGSTDRTGEIGRKYAEQYADKIRYVFQENKKQGGARNTGLRMVETAYVAFLDSDDWLMPDYVERIVKMVKRAESPPEMVMTLPVIYHEQSRAVRDWYDRELFERVFPEDGRVAEPEKEPLLYQFEVNVCRKVLHMDFVRRTRFAFREGVKWEDLYPHFFLLSACRSCMGVSVGFYYRIGDRAQTTASGGSDRLDVLPAFEDLLTYVGQGREDLIFPAMRVILRFAFWCIHMADVETRRPLVDRLHAFFRKLPKRYFRILRRGSMRRFSAGDALQYSLLAAALRYRVCRVVFYDYLGQEICEKLIKKVLRAENKVA